MKRRLRQLAARLPVAWTDVNWLPPVKQMARRLVKLSLHQPGAVSSRSFNFRQMPLIRCSSARWNL